MVLLTGKVSVTLTPYSALISVQLTDIVWEDNATVEQDTPDLIVVFNVEETTICTMEHALTPKFAQMELQPTNIPKNV